MTQGTSVAMAPQMLVEGQRLDQPTFHELYEAMPPGTRAELIDGVVYMPSPVGSEHGEAHVPVIVWLDYYADQTPGVKALDNATTILGWKSEPQPDGLLRIVAECGGRTWIDGGFIHALLSSSLRSPRRLDSLTLGRSCEITNEPAFSNTWFASSTRMRSSGMAKNKAFWFSGRSAKTGYTAQPYFPGFGSIRKPSLKAIAGGCEPCLIWDAPPPSTPRSWPSLTGFGAVTEAQSRKRGYVFLRWITAHIGANQVMPEGTSVAMAPHMLVEGQRLDQPTFHALYEAMPRGTRAELIEGVVSMPSPVGSGHGEAHVPVIMWLGQYAENTPGVKALDNATTILGWKSEPQPDGLLRILPECGGRTWIDGGFIHGAPELVVEVAKATRFVDLGPKLRDYERAGVLEYVVRAFDPDEIFWFGQEQGVLVQRSIGEGGLYRSAVFAGLWLDPQALMSGDTRRQREVLDLGCATPEHAAFLVQLARVRSST